VVALTGEAGDREPERGASLVEYALIIAFVALCCLAVVALIGSETSPGLSSAGSAFGP
jgi:Flp pilus assembly pilin Flp